MSVKLTNFVKINIKNHLYVGSVGTRETAALIHYKSDLASATDVVLDKIPDYTDSGYLHLAGIKDYINAFFSNYGKKLHVYSRASLLPESDKESALSKLLNSMPMEEIVVGFVNDAKENDPITEAEFRAEAIAYNDSKDDERIYQKIFVAEITPYAGFYKDGSAYEKTAGALAAQRYVLKYGDQGIGASVLAYYTNIYIDKTDAAEDYAFTSENYTNKEASGSNPEKNYVFNDNALVTFAINNDINIDTFLAGSVKVVGGNDYAGYSITNQFMLILVHQILTSALVQVITSKIKYSSYGVSAVVARISSELNRFVSNGYLSVDKVWTDPDLYYSANGKNYKIISKNTPLSLGYYITVLPFESLTPEQIQARQLPNIYILLADSYAIRKIVIDGEVF